MYTTFYMVVVIVGFLSLVLFLVSQEERRVQERRQKTVPVAVERRVAGRRNESSHLYL